MRVPPPSQQSGPLAGHVRKGRTYRSPLAATGLLQVGDWARYDLPDLIWPALVLAERGTAAARQFVRWQAAMLDDLREHGEPGFVAACLDGRLSGLDRLVTQGPGVPSVVRSKAEQFGLLPEAVSLALAAYEGRPAHWLIGNGVKSPTDADLDLLWRAVLESVTDGHREAVIKCLSIWGSVQAGTFSASAETIELLRFYPNAEGTRRQADSVVRASWGARKAFQLHEDASCFDTALQWARVFWSQNMAASSCIRRPKHSADVDDTEHSAVVSPSVDEEAEEVLPPAVMPEGGVQLRRRAMILLGAYVEMVETSPGPEYDREQQEVHSGLVARVGRDVITALGAPDLWCMEHGAHIVRALVEVRIYLQWMDQQDSSIYQVFQDYGAGKAKLYAKIMEEQSENSQRADVKEAIDELTRLSHNDETIDHRVVDTRDSFAPGKSIRTMAEECGLIDFYRQCYYMASGVAHSEWWSVENHAMERCLNVLHGGHLIPSLILNAGENVEFAKSWVDQLYALIRYSLRTLGVSEQVVEDGFASLAADAQQEESGDTAFEPDDTENQQHREPEQ